MGDGCDGCGTSGEVAIDGSLMGALSPGTDAGALMGAYRWLKDYGAMPREGALSSQPARWVETVELIDGMRGTMEEMKDKAKERAAKAAEVFARRIKKG